MRPLSAVVLAAAVLLFGFILVRVDLAETWQLLLNVGWSGVAVILAVYLLTFVIDTATWFVTIPSAALRLTTFHRLWQVMMYGEALNKVLPLASVGGEPVKAMLIKRHLGVGFHEGTASIVLFHTVATVALVVFVLIGFLLMLDSPALAGHRLNAAIGLGVFTVGATLMLVLQRLQVVSGLGEWVSRKAWGEGLRRGLAAVRDIEQRLIEFYARRPKRFALAFTLAFANWVLGVVEVYLAMRFLGAEVSFAEAWIIEAVVVLVRSALFVVPANIGTQEGTFVFICAALIGSASVGLGTAAIIRLRGLLWILWGLLIGVQVERSRPVAGTGSDTNPGV